MGLTKYMRDEGFTLMEMAVTLAIVATLVAVLVPIVTNYVSDARIARAQSDVHAIGTAISNFQKDVGRYPMFTNAALGTSDGLANVVRLEITGTVLSESSGGISAWTATGTITGTDCLAANCVKDTYDDQLVTNGPGYATSSNPSKQFVWKGPYITTDVDPWNHSYLVNIIECRSGSTNACFVLSAGPDGIIQTPFAQNVKTFAVLGDDIVYRIK
jgi:prepilin-type N-terminal cleavage/methylation domain-containing protein